MNFGSSNNCLFPYRVVGVWRSGAKVDSLGLGSVVFSLKRQILPSEEYCSCHFLYEKGS